MTSRAGVRADTRAWTRRVLVIGATVALVVLSVVAAVIALGVPSLDKTRVAQVVYLFDPVWFGLIGGFLVLKRPANLIGWALWVISFSLLSSTLTEALLNRHAAGRRVPSGLIGWSAWLDNWSWVFAFAPLVSLLLRFPDGRLAGRGWRRLELAVFAACGLSLLVLIGAPQNRDYHGVPIPVHFGWLGSVPPAVQWIVGSTGFLAALVGILAGAIGLLLRLRRSHGAERAQLQWLLFAAGWAGGLLLVAVLLDIVTGGRQNMPQALLPVYDLLGQLGIPLIPVTVAVAVMRYGLYEIGRVVSRTVSYAVVLAVLAGAYVGVVAGTSALVPDRFGSVAVVLATLAVSALFLPVRRRVVGAVDRRFNRSRYDAGVVVAQFAERVRGRAGTGTTGEDLVAAACQVLEPAHASVWLVGQGRS